MDINFVVNIIYITAMIALGGFALWCKGNGTIKGMVASLIAEAEAMYQDTTKSGGKKFEWVVNQLCARMPILSQEAARALVQTTFNAVESYSKLQLDKVAEDAARRIKE